MSSSRRHHARSPAVPPLDDDDLLCEILLRLPPQPSSLPRASAVCKRWRLLVRDPSFCRRFRLRHRRSAPLLGFFGRLGDLPFLPTLEGPNRVPPGRFSLQPEDDDDEGNTYRSLGCRHGLLLIFIRKRLQVLVWDPVTGDKNRIAVPAAFGREKTQVKGAVLRAAGDVQHFQVVLVGADGDDEQHVRALACAYSSKTGLWGNLVSTPVPYHQANGSSFPSMVYMHDAVLAGGSLYWKLSGDLFGILEFDLDKESLAVIRVPLDLDVHGEEYGFMIMRAEGGGLGFLRILDYIAQLWKRKTGCDGVTYWVLGRTIELDKVVPMGSRKNLPLVILGYAEENNVLLLWTIAGLFTIHLESLESKKLFETMTFFYYHPFECVYTAETCAGGGQDRAEILLNA